ncbi:MAG: pilus assembly protein PilP [Pseudobacteriovorax sp.]|nr:pilus assembly protein PilP [Pseudobacteriovorax sp.]
MKKVLGLVALVSAFSAAAQNDLEVLDLTDLDLKEDAIPIEDLKDRSVGNGLNIEEIVEPTTEYRYSSFGNDDPFLAPPAKSIDQEIKEQTEAEKVFGSEIPMVSPLQAYPLEQLSVKGVWKLPDGESRAVIMTPKKEGVVVKKGDPIAVGKILDIQRRRLLVRQYRLREDGTRVFTDIEVNIGDIKKDEIGTIRLRPGANPQFDRLDKTSIRDDSPLPAPGGVPLTQRNPEAQNLGNPYGSPNINQPASTTITNNPGAGTQTPGRVGVNSLPNQVPDTIIKDGPNQQPANGVDQEEVQRAARQLGFTP